MRNQPDLFPAAPNCIARDLANSEKGPGRGALPENSPFPSMDGETRWFRPRSATSDPNPKKQTFKPMKNKLTAEFFGTFWLVFGGCGSAVLAALFLTDGASPTQLGIGFVGVSLAFGLTVLTMAYAIGHISGCHLNPAVTAGLVAAGRFTARLAVPYVGAQLLGAFLASVALRFLFPASLTLGATLPVGGVPQSCALEFLLTFMLMAVILLTTVGPREKTMLAGVAIGGVIGLEAMFAGPVCGASMNPARSLAPALVSGHLAGLWIYLTAPVLGAALGVALFQQLAPADNAGSSAERG